MKVKKYLAIIFSAGLLALSACSAPEKDSAALTDFRNTVDSFCEEVSAIDADINASGDTENTEKVLTDLDSLKQAFSDFAAVDFPSDYDYLENLADEASDYMNTAVDSYHQAFEAETKEALEAKYDYAKENYSRAYKRIKVIVSFLNGETSEDATVVSE